MNTCRLDHSRVALVADIGRTAVRLSMTDEGGHLRRDAVRSYDISVEASIPHIVERFANELALGSLPSRCAIAVSGVPRGDVIQVTNSRLILSRAEVGTLLGAPPLILNDFAANGWAISSQSCANRVQPLNGATVRPYQPGSYCVIGVGSGLGVALLTRDAYGVVNVIPTEAGHMGLMAGLPEAEAVAEIIAARRGHLSGEAMLSKSGLIAIYQALARIRGVDVLCVPDLVRPGAARDDVLATETHELFAKTLWHVAGNLVLAYGAWDGVILTGSIVASLRPALRRPNVMQRFLVEGPYSDRLRDVPRSTVSFEHAELEGAAAALLHEDERRATTDEPGAAKIVEHPTRRRARRNGRADLAPIPNLPS